MKKIKLSIWLFMIVVAFCFCNNGSTKSKAIQKDKDKEIGIFIEESFAALGDMPTSDQLYTLVENISERKAKLMMDSTTSIKEFSDTIGSRVNRIFCYFQKDRLIAVQNRIRIIDLENKSKEISCMLFAFDENNCCFENLRQDNKNDTPRYFTYYKNKIVVSGSMINPHFIDSTQKQEIINRAKASLDSTMQHFPEFKYSFNWK
jgi:hypothetical protein